MRFIIAIICAAVAAVAVPAAAHADTTCKDARVDGVRVSLTVWGSTSCGLGVNTARAVVSRGYAPHTLRVKSPATGNRYTLRRANLENNFADYWSVVYTGKGRGNSSINVQLQVWY